jgi:DNA-binding CsgD family transcriptional regulator
MECQALPTTVEPTTMINERTQRAFLLFYSGHNQQEIADDLATFKTDVNALLNTHAIEWIRDRLLSTYKQRLLDLAASGRNSQQIADTLGKPWNRYSVTFTLRHLKAILKTQGYINHPSHLSKTVAVETKHTFRCSRCNAHFQQTLTDSRLNPDRLCSSTPTHDGCIDRREIERRGINRVDPSR